MHFYHEFSFPRAGSNAVRKESLELWDFKVLKEREVLKVSKDISGLRAKWGRTVSPDARATWE